MKKLSEIDYPEFKYEVDKLLPLILDQSSKYLIDNFIIAKGVRIHDKDEYDSNGRILFIFSGNLTFHGRTPSNLEFRVKYSAIDLKNMSPVDIYGNISIPEDVDNDFKMGEFLNYVQMKLETVNRRFFKKVKDTKALETLYNLEEVYKLAEASKPALFPKLPDPQNSLKPLT